MMKSGYRPMIRDPINGRGITRESNSGCGRRIIRVSVGTALGMATLGNGRGSK